MAKQLRNGGASVRARLLTLAQQKSLPFDILLIRYALERFLYRLSRSEYSGRFALKGAMLMTTWFDQPQRPTRDLDLLGFGDPAADPMVAVFREICGTEVEDDGIAFDGTGLRVEQIREELEYGGLRLRTTATLAGAVINVVVDIGFGDAVEPGLQEIDLPVLLDMPSPHLRAYPRETVIAEKFQAMVALGRANSRMKDFYDVWLLSRAALYVGMTTATFGADKDTLWPVECREARREAGIMQGERGREPSERHTSRRGRDVDAL